MLLFPTLIYCAAYVIFFLVELDWVCLWFCVQVVDFLHLMALPKEERSLFFCKTSSQIDTQTHSLSPDYYRFLHSPLKRLVFWVWLHFLFLISLFPKGAPSWPHRAQAADGKLGDSSCSARRGGFPWPQSNAFCRPEQPCVFVTMFLSLNLILTFSQLSYASYP